MHRPRIQDGHRARPSRRLPHSLRLLALIEQRGISGSSVFVLLSIAVLGFARMIPPGVASLVVFGVVMTEFIRRIDQGIPLMQITALIATMQWLIGPCLSYYGGLEHGRYFMYVSDGYYFHFALPATAVYCAAVLLYGGAVHQRLLVQSTDRRNYFTIGVVLVAISFVAQAVAGSMPGGLSFLFHLCSQLRYVGALYFLFSQRQGRYLFALASCAPLLFASAESGMFHDLILWAAMLSTYWFAQRPWALGQKILFVLFGFLCVFMIQVVKQDYRRKLESGKSASLVGEIVGAITQERFLEEDVLSLATARLNQGWIISAVMRNVPYNEPFAGGETIKTAFVASLVPRLLWADKKGAGGQENFMRFTGLPIAPGTSMGISPLGEAYANYGIEGGILFMGVFGLCFSLLYHIVLGRVARHPDMIFWIPLMFYQGIKAETEMIVVVNQLLKGGFVVFVGYYALTHVLFPFLTGAAHQSMLRPRSARSYGSRV